MISVELITGLKVGLEYITSKEYGFVVALDLGIIRIMWYKDLVADHA